MVQLEKLAEEKVLWRAYYVVEALASETIAYDEHYNNYPSLQSNMRLIPDEETCMLAEELGWLSSYHITHS